MVPLETLVFHPIYLHVLLQVYAYLDTKLNFILRMANMHGSTRSVYSQICLRKWIFEENQSDYTKCTRLYYLVFLRESAHIREGDHDHNKTDCTCNSFSNRGAHGNNSCIGNCTSLLIEIKQD